MTADTMATAGSRLAMTAVKSQWRLTLGRFSRDRWSVAAACVFAVIVFVSFGGGAIASAALGHNGTDPFPYAANINRKPVGPLAWVPDTHVAYGYGPMQTSHRPRRTPPEHSSSSARTASWATTSSCSCSTAARPRWRSASAQLPSRS